MIFSQMSQKKYNRLFIALHGRNERLLQAGIVRELRKEIRSAEYNVNNYKSVLKGLEFEGLEKELIKNYNRAGQIGNILFKDLEKLKTKKQNPFISDYWLNYVKFTGTRLIARKVVTIKETLIEDLAGVITQVLNENIDLVNLTSVIHDFAGKRDFYKWQAKRIARTETTQALNTAMVEGANQTGLRLRKIWISAEDDRVREGDFNHSNIAPVDKDEPFDVSGEKLMMPGDSAGSAGNVINCRCSVAFEPYRDEQGNLIL